MGGIRYTARLERSSGGPSTMSNYDVLASRMRAHFPDARWAAHGLEIAGYEVLRRALATGAHLRVGFEDAIHLPDGRLATSNADLVEWAVSEVLAQGVKVATAEDARRIIGGWS